MDFIEANGVGLRCELSGGGDRTLVLVHEMGGSLESWDDVVPRFAESRRVLRYDTRGAGLSQKVRGQLNVDTMADDIAALLDALGIAGPVALAAVALGGAIALHFAARYPARTSAVSPLWAGLIALLNSGRSQPVGFVTPKLYALNSSANALRDITEGDNGVNQVKGYKAEAGWDPCCGLGSPNGANLLAAL